LASTTVLDDHRPGGPSAAELANEPEILDVSPQDAQRLLAILLGGSESALTWRRVQILTLAAQRMSVAAIAELVCVEPAGIGEVIADFNRTGFDSLYPTRVDSQATA
jgi:hypothetical protein